MFGRGLLVAAGLLGCLIAWMAGVASAQVRIEIPTVDVPSRRPNPQTGVDMGDLAGGLFALRDGFDRTRKGYICVLTYDDRNGNGQRDRGEGPLPGWGFTITDAAGATVGHGLSGKEGRFCNERPLAPGAYSVRQSPGADWINTEPGEASPNLKPMTLPADSSVTVLFGNCRGERCEARGPAPQGPPPPTPQTSAQVCVAKYNDLDGDGVRDAGEPGIPGWIFSVKTASGTMLAFGTTNAQGEWCSTATLPPGAINVFETAQAGWTSTDPANVPNGTPPKKAATLVAGQTTNVVFGNRTARVCVAKFNDLNGNGVKNPGEPFLAGWAFSLQGVSGQTLDGGVTDAQGQWCSTAVLPTGYPVSVIETQQSGWQNTSPGGAQKLSANPTRTLALTAAQSGNVSFGNWIPPATGKLCVRKFRDLNSDGQEGGTGEPVLPGWTFTVTGPSGPITLVTGANGKACTPANLTPGSYTVTETLQSGWSNTVPGNATASKVVTVNATGTADVNFGNVPVPPGILCVNKYQDVVRNNRYDAADPMLAGWTFEVRNSSGTVVATAVTDAQGRWCSPAPLPAGTYTVTEAPQSGWVVVDPMGPPNVAPPYKKTALLSATRGADLFFGNIRSGMACITKYNDLNGNGHRDPGEPPLAGFTFHFQYTGSSHATDVHLTTGPSGEVCLELPPGTSHWVWELPKPGWTRTEGGPGGSSGVGSVGGYVFAIEEGKTTQLAFGNRQTGTPTYGRICVVKFNDLDGDGVKQAGEPFLPGWAFSIPTPNGTMSSTTDAAGGWCTPQVFPTGTYTVTETLKPGWSATTPGGPSQFASVTGGQTNTLTFGNRQTQAAPGRICVVKFKDTNGDGVKQANEPLLPGWIFTVSGASTQSGATDEQKGEWCTKQALAPGTYTVTETMKPGWVSSTPGGTTPQITAVVVAGQTTTVLFGNRQLTAPTPARLTVQKIKLTSGICHGALPAQNECLFQITVTNVGGAAYTGPITLSDTLTGAQAAVMTSAGLTCPTGPQNGAFTCTAPTTTIPAGGSVQFQLKLLLAAAAPAQKNCVALSYLLGGTTQTATACAQIYP